MLAQIEATQDHQNNGKDAHPRGHAADDRGKERQARDVTAGKRAREGDLHVRQQLDRARPVGRRRGMGDGELQQRLYRDDCNDEKRNEAVAGRAARPRHGEAEREANGDLSKTEEADERTDRVEERASKGLRRIERPLVDAYSDSSKVSFDRRKYQKPRTKMTSANAAE